MIDLLGGHDLTCGSSGRVRGGPNRRVFPSPVPVEALRRVDRETAGHNRRWPGASGGSTDQRGRSTVRARTTISWRSAAPSADKARHETGAPGSSKASRKRSGLRAGLAGIGVAVAVFLLYLATLAPTVLPYRYPELRDSAVMQVKVALLTIPDYTGYPTHMMLTHLFMYLPFGDEAYRVNLSSAVYGALAVYVIYRICLRLTKGWIVPSVAGALVFGVSPTFWSQAVVAEIYTFNALLVALTVLALLAWRDERRDLYGLLALFLAGLSLTHHLTSGLLLPAAFLLVALVSWRKLLEWRLVLAGAGLFVLGLLPYAYLPIRAYMRPPLSNADPTSFERFWDLVSGGDYKAEMFAFGLAELPDRLAYYGGHLLDQFHPAFLAVALLGVASMFLRDRAGLALLGFLYLGWLVYALEYDIADVYVYFIPTYLILSLWTAVGLASLLRWLESWSKTRTVAHPTSAVLAAAVPALMLAAPFAGIGSTFDLVDHSEDYEGRREIEAVAEGTKPGSTVLQRRSPLAYMQLVEGRRQDLRLAAAPYRSPDGEMQGIERAGTLLKDGPVYVLDPTDVMTREYESAGYALIPIQKDMLYEVVEQGKRSQIPRPE